MLSMPAGGLGSFALRWAMGLGGPTGPGYWPYILARSSSCCSADMSGLNCSLMGSKRYAAAAAASR